jgi:hypothetical protein
LTGGSKRPIEIQRGTGMRAMQNRARLPAALARAIGAAVSIGAAVDRNEDRWLDVRSASCFLVHGRKP